LLITKRGREMDKHLLERFLEEQMEEYFPNNEKREVVIITVKNKTFRLWYNPIRSLLCGRCFYPGSGFYNIYSKDHLDFTKALRGLECERAKGLNSYSLTTQSGLTITIEVYVPDEETLRKLEAELEAYKGG
jgi:hypothetical protein